jgi:hypothetical protein
VRIVVAVRALRLVLYDAGAKKGRAGDANFINNASRSTPVKI